MLPSILPLGAVPITSGQDPARPRPDIPPVAAVQPGSGDSAIDLDNHDTDQATLLLREEQQRQHDKRRRETLEDEGQMVAGNVPSPEAVLPVVDGMQRQGLWVDIKV